jgi:hypothetical protein
MRIKWCCKFLLPSPSPLSLSLSPPPPTLARRWTYFHTIQAQAEQTDSEVARARRVVETSEANFAAKVTRSINAIDLEPDDPNDWNDFNSDVDDDDDGDDGSRIDNKQLTVTTDDLASAQEAAEQLEDELRFKDLQLKLAAASLSPPQLAAMQKERKQLERLLAEKRAAVEVLRRGGEGGQGGGGEGGGGSQGTGPGQRKSNSKSASSLEAERVSSGARAWR